MDGQPLNASNKTPNDTSSSSNARSANKTASDTSGSSNAQGSISNEAIKELLLADHAHFSSMFVNSEQSGETRVNWFIGIVTATTGGLLALIVKQRESHDTLLTPALLFAIMFAAVCGLLSFGIITLMRMMLRNSSTDRQKRALDEVRQMFQDHFDPQHMLTLYHPLGIAKKKPPKAQPETEKARSDQQKSAQAMKAAKSVTDSQEEKEEEKEERERAWEEFKSELRKQRKTGRLRRLGGLAHTVAAINSLLVSVLLGLIAYAVLRVVGMSPLPAPNRYELILWGIGILIVCLMAFALQWLWITYSEIKARLKLYAGDCTHAGGVVYDRSDGKVSYLLIRPPSDPTRNEWVLPKGKIEEYESHQEAALREVKEETGIGARIVSLLGQIEFKAGGKLVRSKFYLMERIDGEKLPDHWKEFDEANAALKSESKTMLALAQQRLQHM